RPRTVPALCRSGWEGRSFQASPGLRSLAGDRTGTRFVVFGQGHPSQGHRQGEGAPPRKTDVLQLVVAGLRENVAVLRHIDVGRLRRLLLARRQRADPRGEVALPAVALPAVVSCGTPLGLPGQTTAAMDHPRTANALA